MLLNQFVNSPSYNMVVPRGIQGATTFMMEQTHRATTSTLVPSYKKRTSSQPPRSSRRTGRGARRLGRSPFFVYFFHHFFQYLFHVPPTKSLSALLLAVCTRTLGPSPCSTTLVSLSGTHNTFDRNPRRENRRTTFWKKIPAPCCSRTSNECCALKICRNSLLGHCPFVHSRAPAPHDAHTVTSPTHYPRIDYKNGLVHRPIVQESRITNKFKTLHQLR